MNRLLLIALGTCAALGLAAEQPNPPVLPGQTPEPPSAELRKAEPGAEPSAEQQLRVQRLKAGIERKLNRGTRGERLARSAEWQKRFAEQSVQPLEVAAADGSESSLLRFDKPQEAQSHFLAKRLAPGRMAIGPSDYKAGLEQAERMPQRGALSAPARGNLSGARALRTQASVAAAALPNNWTARGPGNIGGRTRALLIHPSTPDTLWAAGVAGGIWKSTDGGSSWTPKADLLVNIAVNSMVLDPRNPNILYAGTGEGFFNGDAVRGAGVLKSVDGGETWTQLPSTADTPDFHYVQKLVMSKGSSQRLYAATRTGVFRSTDGGGSWTKMLDGSGVNGCMDLAIQTDRALAQVFASCGTFTQGAIYRALDTGGTQNWVQVHAPAGMGRTTLAIAPSNQNIVYAMAASSVSASPFNNGLLAVYRSNSAGAAGSWTTQVDNTSPVTLNRLLLSNTVFGALSQCAFGTTALLNQGWYDNALAVDPVNPEIVWAGGIDLFRSDDGGRNWGQASHWWFNAGVDPEYNHADQHLIVFHPQYNGSSNRILYTANDGGVHRTLDARAPVAYSPDPITPSSPVCGNTPAGLVRWQALNNGYQVTQFYHGAVYPDGTRYLGGTQDNGTLRGSDASTSWETIRGGDGGYVAVNPANSDMLWAENTGLSIQRSLNGGATYASFTSGITEGSGNFLFITPFAQDPSNPAIMWIGGAFPWRSTQATAVPTVGSIWTRAGSFFGARVSAWGISPVDSNRVYAGTQTGRVFRNGAALSADASTVWPASSPRPGNNYVSWVQPDPVNVNRVYATVSTFNGPGSVGHVFRSDDGGANWVSIDGSGATGLPDVPAHSIVIDPADTQRLYVGTDIGVFSSSDGGANWARENSGFANVIVESLAIKGRRLYAFTHGRSVFTTDLP